MKTEVATALADQANHEFFAAHSYQAIALWCAYNEYPGFASFFEAQATEEREHAEKFIEHLLDRGVPPELSAMEKPKGDFSSLSEVAGYALSLEKLNSEKIRNCYEISLDCKDYESQTLLLWFINEQVEEEAWADRMITLTKRAECPGAALNLDRHIIKILSAGE